jgi:membrane protease YdiL (CAAX protease family)
MSILLAILFILIPFELGFLLYQGKRINGRFSLKGVVLFRERTPVWQTILLVVVLFVWCALWFSILPKVDTYFVQHWFGWFPSWSLPGNTLGDPSQYSKSALALTLLAGLALNGIVGPIVEELYFRGFLLPRIQASRWVAPLINVLLFSLYHFFSPRQNVTRVLALLPLVYAVAWKRNITLGMWTHCLLNTLGMVSTLTLLFR